ncbi:hypothetical protein [Gottfriedia acidiceleris]|uniref:hypothetical protein n=1 Tax=Gottfriedia acidiceleris TaxID=371036 RepID=UPI00101D6D5F|nr:hypothetical protein [Gottfriedia acidiceleris]
MNRKLMNRKLLKRKSTLSNSMKRESIKKKKQESKSRLIGSYFWFYGLFLIPLLIVSIPDMLFQTYASRDAHKNLEHFYNTHSLLINSLALGATLYCFFMGMKKVRVSEKVARGFEFIGYALLFFALIWQTLFIDPGESFEDGYYKNSLETKLDHIWNYMHQIDSSSNSEEYFQNNDGTDEDQFQFYEIITDLDNQNEDAVNKGIFSLVYLISTIFIAIGRFHEISYTSQPSNNYARQSIKHRILSVLKIKKDDPN